MKYEKANIEQLQVSLACFVFYLAYNPSGSDGLSWKPGDGTAGFLQAGPEGLQCW